LSKISEISIPESFRFCLQRWITLLQDMSFLFCMANFLHYSAGERETVVCFL